MTLKWLVKTLYGCSHSNFKSGLNSIQNFWFPFQYSWRSVFIDKHPTPSSPKPHKQFCPSSQTLLNQTLIKHFNQEIFHYELPDVCILFVVLFGDELQLDNWTWRQTFKVLVILAFKLGRYRVLFCFFVFWAEGLILFLWQWITSVLYAATSVLVFPFTTAINCTGNLGGSEPAALFGLLYMPYCNWLVFPLICTCANQESVYYSK